MSHQLFITLALLLAASSQAAPKEGGGVRGGGQVVEVNGTLELVDLVTSATCDWSTGREFYAKNPALDTLLGKVAKLDWYFAGELRREIQFLRWCMTGPLYRVYDSDQDSFVVQLTRGVQQAAFRYLDAAYIDSSRFNRLSPRSRALLIIHEAMHSYLDMRDPMRKLHLMSMVKAIARVDSGEINSREKLHLQMDMNEVNFPLTVAELDRYRTQVEFLVSSPQDRSAMLLARSNPEDLASVQAETLLPLLASWDQASAWNPLGALTVTLQEMMVDGAAAQFQTLLKDKFYQKLNPAQIAMSVIDLLDEAKRAVLFASPWFPRIFAEQFNFLLQASVHQAAYRIQASPELQSVGAEKAATAPKPLTQLKPRSNQGDSAPLHWTTQAMANSLAYFAETGEWAQVEALFLRNPAFYASLGLKNQLTAVNAMTTPIAREKPLALSVLKELRNGLLTEFWTEVSARVSPSTYQEIMKRVRHADFETELQF